MNPDANAPEGRLPPVVPAPEPPVGPDPAVLPDPAPNGAAVPALNAVAAPVLVGHQARHGAWKDLVKEQGFQPYELAYALEAAAVGVPVEEALLATQEYMEDLLAEPNPVWKNEVTRNITGPVGRHYLTVMDYKVCTVSTPRFCGVHSRGSDRILALSGERVPVGAGQNFSQLPLVKLSGNVGAQWAEFGLVTARAKPFEEIAESAEGGDMDLEEELPMGEETVTTVKMLMVHAKIAAMFTRGVEVKQAAVLVREIRDLVPPQYRDRCQALVDFVRVAATEDGDQKSVCETSWGRTDPVTSTALEKWYHELLEAAVPAWASGANGPQNREEAPAAVPQGGSEIGMLAAVIQQMSATQAATVTANSERVKSKAPFMPAEIRKILKAVYPRDRLEGLGTESLPPFWTKLVEYRASLDKIRTFVQEYTQEFAAGSEDGMLEFFWSPQLISTIKGLTFGGDKGGSFKARTQGLSVFAWAPSHLTQSSLLNERIATAMRLESNYERHRDEDARALLELSINGEPIPTTYERVLTYIEHDIHVLEMLFGDQCLPLRCCDEIVGLLKRKSVLFQRYKPTHWAGLLWDYHLARLEATDGEGTDSLKFLVQRMRQGQLPDLDRFAEDAQSAILQAAGVSVPSRTGRRAEWGSGDSDHATKRARTEEWLIHPTWAADVEKAKKAIAPTELTGRLVFPSQEQSKKVYGEGFRSLAGTRAPCDRWFVLGECKFGNGCRFSHGGPTRPSDKVIQGVHMRLKTRLEEVVAEQKK